MKFATLILAAVAAVATASVVEVTAPAPAIALDLEARVRSRSLRELVPCLLIRICLFSKAASPHPTAPVTESKVRFAATKRSTASAPTDMSSSAAPVPVKLATTASGTHYVESKQSELDTRNAEIEGG
ncbi:unnamed protein product [Cyclocybe aegerita]|uniref:Antifreeze protein n=1 Tax=Cyclocybe aegerita TaxID=1973307 RepID=A0A8S0WPU8_CYCAE|nr:unnamed protein product [Cyclocybe aegerita]